MIHALAEAVNGPPTWGSILIAFIVGLFGWLQVRSSRKTGEKAADAVKEVKVETEKVATAASNAATSHTEVLLAKNDQVLSKLQTLERTVERNRHQNQREHQENLAKITRLAEGQDTLFNMICEVDRKVTPKPKTTKQPVEVQ